MKLYYSPGACSLAAHIVAEEGGLPLELVKVDLKTHKLEDGRDFYEVNPKGYVPAIEVDGGGVLSENAAVLNYLADHTGDKLFTPKHGSMERYRLEEWLAFISTEIHKSFAPLFHGGSSDEKNKAKEHILKRLSHVDSRLVGQDYLMGSAMSVADAYLYVMLTWAKKLHLDTGALSNLNAFFARMSQRDSVKRTLEAEVLPHK
jgi:glutathione S-transferase